MASRRSWDVSYRAELAERFESALLRAEKSLAPLPSAYVTPSLDSLAIGESKKISGSPMFFDISGFSSRITGSDDAEMSDALTTLHALIPVVMSAIYDFGGYVEKNTGDGVLGIFPDDDSAEDTVSRSLECSLSIRALVDELVNPLLAERGIPAIEYRITMDYGTLAITRLGLPSGSSPFARNFLVVVGTPANIASKIESLCPAGETWVGANVWRYAGVHQQYMVNVTPRDWEWTYTSTGAPYSVWRYTAVWKDSSALQAHVKNVRLR